ncbi:immunoglobulin-like domain-containing protein [Thermococcus sp.]|uniref:immunoglobulin-like domain-containing protein n=1 Tax=Thermococcus sp. TaxID=35749 RepID=UPI002624F26D|nr:immunoglobulin-like domain-containing protein [Thermococcus sp.]
MGRLRMLISILLIALLLPVGYLLAPHHGIGSSSGGNTTNLNETLGSIVVSGHGVVQLDGQVYPMNGTLKLTITNDNNSTLTTGYGFRLYRRENGRWMKVKLDIAFPQVVVEVKPHSSWSQRIDLSRLNLKPGTYRIEKRVCFDGICGPQWAEFEIGN